MPSRSPRWRRLPPAYADRGFLSIDGRSRGRYPIENKVRSARKQKLVLFARRLALGTVGYEKWPAGAGRRDSPHLRASGESRSTMTPQSASLHSLDQLLGPSWVRQRAEMLGMLLQAEGRSEVGQGE